MEDIQGIVAKLKYKNIGILITDHNVQETLSITDRIKFWPRYTFLTCSSAASSSADPDFRILPSNNPIHTYDTIKPYIQRTMEGQQNVLWNTPIKWFAKSSGTTADKSKFIPVTVESLDECHYRSGRDVISLYYNNFPDSDVFTGKSLVIGGIKGLRISFLNCSR